MHSLEKTGTVVFFGSIDVIVHSPESQRPIIGSCLEELSLSEAYFKAWRKVLVDNNSWTIPPIQVHIPSPEW